MTIRKMLRRSLGVLPRGWLVASLLLGWLSASSVYAVDYETESDSGRIEKVNLDQGTMMVDGRLYWTGPDLQVEINGSYGAFTMLKPGMFIEMEYRIKLGEQRELYKVQEVIHARFHAES